MNLSILPAAWDEGLSAYDWYESQRIGLGDQFLSEIQRVLTSIEERPFSFPRWEAYHGKEEIRWSSLKRFRYVMIFIVEGEEIVVLAISHAHRHPLYWLSRLE